MTTPFGAPSQLERRLGDVTWRRMGASRRGLEAILRRLGGVLETYGAVLETSGGVFKTSLRRFGSVWRRLGRELGKYFFGLGGRVLSFAEFRTTFDNLGTIF